MLNEQHRATRGRQMQTRRLPETKTFLATSEFWVCAIAIAALLVAGYILDDIADPTAWRYATWVAVAYIVSRGIAKAGSQRTYEYDEPNQASDDRRAEVATPRRDNEVPYVETQRAN